MANLVKSKIGIGAASLLTIFIIAAFEANFYRIPVIKKWSAENPLTWDDFRDIGSPFNSHDAQIDSKIYVEYDSHKATYRVYAGQNNLKSWVRGSAVGSWHLLKHEQYHFNITELYARKLNKVLLHKADLSPAIINKERRNIDASMAETQGLYDNQTDHNKKEDFQRYWEYKIDSSLTLFEENEGIVTDPFSGISCFFPFPPDHVLNKDTFLLRQGYLLEKYGMQFRFLTMYDSYSDTSHTEKNFVSHLESKGFLNIKSGVRHWNDMFLLETECRDTVGSRIFYDRLIFAPPYEYQVTVTMPLDEKDNHLYLKMKDQFFNSLDIRPRHAYWTDEAGGKDPEIVQVEMNRNLKNTKDKSPGSELLCTTGHSSYAVFYHRPFVQDQFLTIPFKSAKHSLEDIRDITIILNEESMFVQPVDATDNQVVKLDTTQLRPGMNKIQFGYTLKADSLSSCYHLYGSIVEYDF